MTPREVVAVEALRRIADHETRADRRRRGMVDASEVEDLRRTARTALIRLAGMSEAPAVAAQPAAVKALTRIVGELQAWASSGLPRYPRWAESRIRLGRAALAAVAPERPAIDR